MANLVNKAALRMPGTKATTAQVKSGKAETGKKASSERLRDFMRGFNVNSVLLLVAIVLLGVSIAQDGESTSEKAQRVVIVGSKEDIPVRVQQRLDTVSVPPEGRLPYELGAVHVSRNDFDYKSSVSGEVYVKSLPSRIPNDWEYVGVLCHDGINGAWLLVRKRESKPKD